MVDGRSRLAGRGPTSLLEATAGFDEVPYDRGAGAREVQDALRCAGSAALKMFVCGGGVNVLSGDERVG